MPINSIAELKKHTFRKSNELRGKGPRLFKLPPPQVSSHGCELEQFSSSSLNLSFFHQKTKVTLIYLRLN